METPARVLPRPVRTGAGTAGWVRRYGTGLVVFEMLAAATAGASVVLSRAGGVELSSTLFWAAVGLLPAWPLVLLALGAYSERVFGTGSDEYRRVGRAGFLLLAFAGFISYAAALNLSRALIVIAVPTLTLVTLLGRYVARCQLRRLRARGHCTRRVVVVGRGGAALELAARVRREQFAGFEVVALCVTQDDRARVTEVAGVPVAALEEVVALVPPAWVRTPSPSPRRAKPRPNTCGSCPGNWRARAWNCWWPPD